MYSANVRLHDLKIRRKNKAIYNIASMFHNIMPPPYREIHLYGIGLPRSGTHSLAYIFKKHFLAQHEPRNRETIATILEWSAGYCSDRKMSNLLAYRDKILGLDVESSHYLHHVVHLLVNLFPDAKFILTVRDPEQWLESEINQNFLTRNHELWRALDCHRYARYDFKHESTESSLLEYFPKVFPINSHLHYWRDHIEAVLRVVPNDRIFVIDTSEFGKKLHDVATFAGTDVNLLDSSRDWSGKRHDSLNLYQLIDRDLVKRKIESILGGFIREHLSFLNLSEPSPREP